MASLASSRPDELSIQTATFCLQQSEGSSDRLQSVLTSEQNIRRTAAVLSSRLEQLQIQQQPAQNFRTSGGWQSSAFCAVISILMIVLLLTLLDVWMAYLDSGLNSNKSWNVWRRLY